MIEKRKQFILFEGLDCSGKTTCGERLADELGADFLYAMPQFFAEQAKKVVEEDMDAAVDVFSLGNRFRDLDLRERLRFFPVVMDRSYYTTIASHSHLLGVNIDHILDQITVFPDKIYCFYADFDELERRDRMREGGGGDNFYHKRCVWEGAYAEYRRLFEGRENVVWVDTTVKSVEDVYEEVINDVYANNNWN